MSYNSETGIISAPVSIDDVKRALGESSNDLATLCKSENINIWSKYKPVYKGANFITDSLNTDKKSWTAKTTNKGWWLGNADGLNDSGFEINILTSFNDINNLAAWKYKVPSGGANCPFRLSDFIGYNSTDTDDYYNPIHVSRITDNIYVNGTYSIVFYGGDEPTYPNQTIDVQDILNMLSARSTEWYPAICFYNKTKKQMKYISAEQSYKITPNNIHYGDEFYRFTIDLKAGKIYGLDDEYTLGVTVSKGDEIMCVGLLADDYGINEDFFYGSVYPPNLYHPSNGTYLPNICNIIKVSESDKPSYPMQVTITVSDLSIKLNSYNTWVRDENIGVGLQATQYLDFSCKLKTDTPLANAKFNISVEGIAAYDNNYSSVDEFHLDVYDNISVGSISTNGIINISNNDNYKTKRYSSKTDANNDTNYSLDVSIPIVKTAYSQYVYRQKWNITLSINCDVVDHGNSTSYSVFNFTGDYVGKKYMILYEKETVFK